MGWLWSRAVPPEQLSAIAAGRVRARRARSGRGSVAGAAPDIPCSAVTPSTVELSLADWVVLGVVAEGQTYGWPIVRELSPDGALGSVWTVPRPIVYRSLATLTAGGADRGLRRRAGRARAAPHDRAHDDARGRRLLRAWLRTPVEHVRDVRGELLIKLALLARAGRPQRRARRAAAEAAAAGVRRAPTGAGRRRLRRDPRALAARAGEGRRPVPALVARQRRTRGQTGNAVMSVAFTDVHTSTPSSS